MAKNTEVERSVVFRDSEWGLGQFERGNPRVEVNTSGEAWLMIDDRHIDLTNQGCMTPDEARAIADILYAAADEAENILES